jgi:hypothetical protein
MRNTDYLFHNIVFAVSAPSAALRLSMVLAQVMFDETRAGLGEHLEDEVGDLI